MAKWKKVFDKVLSGKADKNIPFDELCGLLTRLGFENRQEKGSHCIYFRDGVVELINLQPREGGKAKMEQVKQIREILLHYGIGID